MARKPRGDGSRKFGAPLCCAAWPAGAYPIVGGKAGKQSSGIPNRAVVLKVENAVLADAEQDKLRMNEMTPFNMALHPEVHTLIVRTGSAGLTDLDLTQQHSNPPILSLAQGQSIHRLRSRRAKTQCSTLPKCSSCCLMSCNRRSALLYSARCWTRSAPPKYATLHWGSSGRFQQELVFKRSRIKV